jgi:hypothetical protein
VPDLEAFLTRIDTVSASQLVEPTPSPSESPGSTGPSDSASPSS